MKKQRNRQMMWIIVGVILGLGMYASACQCASIPNNEMLLPDGSAGKESTTENTGEALQEANLPDGSIESAREALAEEAIEASPDATSPTEGGIEFPKTWPDEIFLPKAPSNRTFASAHFSGATQCSTCHDGIKDGKGEDVSIVKSWSASMMALASRDPFWYAKLESETLRQPQLKSVIDEKCTRCHAPMANHESKVQKKEIVVSETGGGILDPNHPLFHHARAGVSCTLCHQIKPTAEMGTLAGTSGKFQIETFANKADRKIYGPYMDPFTMPMINDVSFTPVGSAHIGQSKLCGSCHDLKTPFVDQQGKIIPQRPEDEFPEQMVYSEWKHSAYNDQGTQPTSCQNCHMPNTKDVKISTRPPWLTPRANFSKHLFVGANLFMLTMMRDHRQLLGIDATAEQFAFTLQHTQQMLESAARIDILESQRQGPSLRVKLRVQNLSGHKLPSGFPSRRVFLHFKLSDNQGKVWFESGKMGAYGQIEGADADLDTTRIEPHHTEITRPDQVQIYEAVMKDTENKPTYALLRGASYAKDNRLLPKGFNKQTAPKDIQVHGDAVQDSDFSDGGDTITYNVPNLPNSGTLKLEVRLMYQTLAYPFAKDLFKDQSSRAVLLFMNLYQKAPFYASLITQRTQDIP